FPPASNSTRPPARSEAHRESPAVTESWSKPTTHSRSRDARSSSVFDERTRRHRVAQVAAVRSRQDRQRRLAHTAHARCPLGARDRDRSGGRRTPPPPQLLITPTAPRPSRPAP